VETNIVNRSPIVDPRDGFSRTLTAIKLFLGAPTAEAPVLSYLKGGYYGYAILVYGSHLDYLADLNATVAPSLPEFDAATIERWQLMNDLVIGGLSRGFPDEDRIPRNYSALAALVAFPTLEELARRVSGRWDEDGWPTREIPGAEGIVTRAPDIPDKPEEFKVGKRRVVQLSHKLQLMHRGLDPGLVRFLDGIDRAGRRSPIQGDATVLAPLYDRLQFFRDRWVHGRKFEGFEALLVSHIIALLYFGKLGAGSISTAARQAEA
jgi:hypothetical protein